MDKNNILHTKENILKEFKKYITKNADLKLVGQAYDMTLKNDDNAQKNISVAMILVNIQMDVETICAALLQDISLDIIKKDFSENIMSLIKGIKRIGKINLSTDSEANIEYYKRIIVGMSDDVRVIIVKLADSLYQMRTLEDLPLKNQKQIAKETLEIIAPIAHRLGVYHLKSELEDLCLKYLKPDVYQDIEEKIAETKPARDEIIQGMLAEVSKLLNKNNIKHEIKGRVKGIYSIYNKLNKGRPFSDIYDIYALRVIVDKVSECYLALGIIHANYTPISKRFKDFIAMPKSNMYQSLHTTVFGKDGVLFEIQIRTQQMNLIAEYGFAAHWSYKDKKKGSNMTPNDKLELFRSMYEDNDNQMSSEELIKTIKYDMKTNIYVFTPRGDVIELPNGSTPIDFAYKVHSKIGDKMIGATVNDNIVSLGYKLKDGDVIKINTNKNSVGPSKEWIKLAKTNQAKSKIKNFFSKLDKDKNIERGRTLLEKEVRKRKLTIKDILDDDDLNDLCNKLKLNSIQDLYLQVGSNNYTPTYIINLLTKGEEEEVITYKEQSDLAQLQNTKDLLIVDGTDGIKVNLASCCMPVYGDDILGIITRSKGISVHKTDCPNIVNNTKTVTVYWNRNVIKKLPTNIIVRTFDKEKALEVIVAKASSIGINIDSINTRNKDIETIYDIILLVENNKQLNKFITELEQLEYIDHIERKRK
ncbi:MAG: RelA/SpoT family protein [Bacilli bacterium]|nr:RelA/SpoT family protein [Bacilli bacterium]